MQCPPQRQKSLEDETYRENVCDFSDDGFVGSLDAVVLGHVVDVVAEEAIDVEHGFAGKHRVDVDAFGSDAVDVLGNKTDISLNFTQGFSYSETSQILSDPKSGQ